MPLRYVLDKKQVVFIKKNYLKIGVKTMAEKLGIGYGIVARYMNEHKLVVPEELKKQFKFINRETKSSITQHDQFLRDNYLTMPVKTIASAIGKKSDITVRTRLRQLGLVIPQEIIEQRKKDSRFKKGQIPVNKGKKQSEYMSPEIIERTKATRFKKGQVSPNKLGIGSITIRSYGVNSKRGANYKIKFIKVGEGKFDWIPLHIHNWLESGQEIPEGFVLAFKDGNSLNSVVENLHLISMKENMLRNSIHNYPEELKEIIMHKGYVKRQIKKNKKNDNR